MRVWVMVGLAVGLTGCVSSGDMELLHREITDVSRQVENLGRQSTGKEDMDVMGRKLAEQSGQLLKSNADIQVELRKLRDQIQSLQAELDSTSQRLSALSNELAATREQGALAQPPNEQIPAPASPNQAPPPAAGNRGNEPTQLYNAAYEDYLRSNFDLAIQGFREYAKRYPNTDLADNALYWVGESYYSKKQFKEAIDAFTELLNTYKSSDKAAAGLLKKGLAYLEMGDRSQAVINLQYVLYEHPGSKEADLARARLQAMGVKVK
ncbi:MAG TPA: tol-pal system protein YbgF [Thermoanaerobaculaceae bacterium]|mgnify:CR=1 FL=1|nr:tol-pal system protein YbgF [Thermoanaerobaculaceae bacterium]HPS77911.1 tol-pal system protein YbgF [Thermoanaerobaculaceae bacterium]